MEETIQALYEEINFLGFHATYHRDNNYVENSKSMIPKVQEFVLWFLKEQQALFEPEVTENLIDVLKDIETALKQYDNVLMMDALEQGISGYLELFLSEEYFKEKENAYVGQAERQKP
ncbi:MAG: hypothetical protein K2N87_17645 [Eubacterium sp.]|nr:hypothetical protein [Eubacterium sp.]